MFKSFNLFKPKKSTVHSGYKDSYSNSNNTNEFSNMVLDPNMEFKDLLITINNYNINEKKIINDLLINPLNLKNCIIELIENNKNKTNYLEKSISYTANENYDLNLYNALHGGKRRKSFKQNLIIKKHNLTKKQRRYLH